MVERTLTDMIRSMTTKTNLPKWLLGEALKTAIYILSRVPSKSISENRRKLNVSHSHIGVVLLQLKFMALKLSSQLVRFSLMILKSVGVLI